MNDVALEEKEGASMMRTTRAREGERENPYGDFLKRRPHIFRQ
jgi:hypothetical protein